MPVADYATLAGHGRLKLVCLQLVVLLTVLCNSADGMMSCACPCDEHTCSCDFKYPEHAGTQLLGVVKQLL